MNADREREKKTKSGLFYFCCASELYPMRKKNDSLMKKMLTNNKNINL